MEHCNVSKSDRTQAYTVEVQRIQTVQTQRQHYSNCIKVMNVLYSYVL
jgi:hypothetical protein